MSDSVQVEKAIAQLLRANNITVSQKYIEQELRTHPDYPSLSSITDMLRTLGVPHAAVRVEQENIKEVPTPFIAHLAGTHVDPDRPSNVNPNPSKPAELVVVNDLDTITREHPDFYDRWDGVVLAIETVTPKDVKNTEKLRQESVNRIASYVFISAFFLITCFAIYNSFSWTNLFLLLTSLSGVGVGMLIFQKERGHSNKFTEHLCNAVAPSGCDRVLHSKGAHLIGWLKLSDIGIVYFLSLSLVFIAACISGNYLPIKTVWSILALASAPFMMFSLFYQWRVLKTWCGLCLITLAILLSQLALLIPNISGYKELAGDIVGPGALLLATFIMVTGAWLLVRMSMFEKDSTERNVESLMRLKRNPDTFMGLLGLQRKVDFSPFEHDLQIGNPKSPIQLTVACNPHCSPCASAHNALHELVEDPDTDIGLTIRFTVHPDSKEDSRTKAAAHMYRYILETGESLGEEQRRLLARKVLHHWYSGMNLEKFAAAHPITKERDVTEILRAHSKWSGASKIEYTPTIFVNGTEFPKAYATQDLKEFLPVFADATN